MTSPSPGMRSPASTSTTSPTLRSSAETPSIDVLHPALAFGIDQPLGLRVGARPAQGVGLRLAAAFGDRFGEIGEEHGEPQPGGDLAREQGGAVLRDEIAHERSRDDRRHDFGDEDHRIAREPSRIELPERIDRRRALMIAGIEEAGSGDFRWT